ncbi:heterokaryon incompatibility protein-domain-containing protein [Halenospora varia]|nr:heterokaryon incompatibility protein-domain-containing protein [Halenospora varia]
MLATRTLSFDASIASTHLPWSDPSKLGLRSLVNQNLVDHGSFVYQHLQLDEIRLLEVLPGQFHDPLRCEVKHTLLPRNHNHVYQPLVFDMPEYHALSYTWGTDSDRRQILIGDTKLLIRKNLWLALKSIRHQFDRSILWIDGICINQSSMQERNEQVQRMAEIFRSAKSVLAWLGDGKKGDDNSLRKIMELAIEPRNQTTRLDEYVEPVMELCKRPYWKRLWVVQELLLAKRILILEGNYSCDFATFRRGWRAARDLLFVSKRKYAFDIESGPYWLMEDTKIWSCNGRVLLDLRALLVMYGEHECGNPLDHIYGLLGIARDCQKGELVADYSKIPEEVAVDVLRMWLTSKSCVNADEIIYYGRHLHRALVEPRQASEHSQWVEVRSDQHQNHQPPELLYKSAYSCRTEEVTKIYQVGKPTTYQALKTLPWRQHFGDLLAQSPVAIPHYLRRAELKLLKNLSFREFQKVFRFQSGSSERQECQGDQTVIPCMTSEGRLALAPLGTQKDESLITIRVDGDISLTLLANISASSVGQECKEHYSVLGRMILLYPHWFRKRPPSGPIIDVSVRWSPEMIQKLVT